MQIYVRVKAVGKRKDVLPPISYTIPDTVCSLRQLLLAVAESETERYNQKQADVQLIPWLTAEEINAQSHAGKVSFGGVFSDRKADKEKAAQNVLQCFEDGLVRVFMQDTELTELDAALTVEEGAVFTFMRLTFLAGRMW